MEINKAGQGFLVKLEGSDREVGGQEKNKMQPDHCLSGSQCGNTTSISSSFFLSFSVLRVSINQDLL